jgi:flagellar basal body-associated protein FliL
MGKTFKQDKGIAGLTILLSLIVMLFVIGLLVMIFTIMGSKMQDSTYDSTTGSVTEEAITGLSNTTGDLLAKSTLRNVACSVSAIMNATSLVTIPASNFTITNCLVKVDGASSYLGQNAKANYTYIYDADNSATDVMNDTTSSVAGVTEWFDIFIVIGAMVVLILLTVVIITAIRSSGMVAGGEQQGANQVGTA